MKTKQKLVRIGDEIFDLSRVVYACLDFDYQGGIALEFSGAQNQSTPYVPLGRLNGIDRLRQRKFRFFAGQPAALLTEIFQREATALDGGRMAAPRIAG